MLPIPFTPGTICLRSTTRFAANETGTPLNPVVFPQGYARLATTPDPTGSATAAITIGIAPVALLAARAWGVPLSTIRSTLRRTNSDARFGRGSLGAAPDPQA